MLDYCLNVAKCNTSFLTHLHCMMCILNVQRIKNDLKEWMDNFKGTFFGCFCLCSPTSIFSSAHSGILGLAESGWSMSCWLKRATVCGDSAADL